MEGVCRKGLSDQKKLAGVSGGPGSRVSETWDASNKGFVASPF